ncbi:sensor histidine kinase [Paraflavitalea pollutisoli]|uniref:sensor histidine kinase n=1 Tax=Paraflavitalea pollutisoli TaxID=3034143 RepID=UPI0023EB6787|nr:histidine kinase [Paraflavitalea sp. H1-2-19X]
MNSSTALHIRPFTWLRPGKKWVLRAWERSFTDRRYRIILHTCFWTFLLFYWLRENLVVHIQVDQPVVITFTGILLSLWLFYPLVYGLVPLLQRRRWFAAVSLFVAYYAVAVVLRTLHIDLLVSLYGREGGFFSGQDFLQGLLAHQLNPSALFRYFFSSLTGLLSIIYIPLAIKFIRYAWRQQWKQVQLEKENIQLELNFLKAQVNPHLLFNSLNNLQSYIIHDEKEKSVDLLNRLAALLRFSIYDCQSEFVAVQQEAQLLQHYMAVEAVRYDEASTIQSDIQAGTLSYSLPALLLMPLVENAFKFSHSLPAANVYVQLITQTDVLRFTCSNDYARDSTTHRGGIGLQNVQKRLQHYFPGRHVMQIDDSGHHFSVTLTIYPPTYELSDRR